MKQDWQEKGANLMRGKKRKKTRDDKIAKGHTAVHTRRRRSMAKEKEVFEEGLKLARADGSKQPLWSRKRLWNTRRRRKHRREEKAGMTMAIHEHDD
jgi:hypothetical protein